MQMATSRWSLLSFKIGQLFHKYPPHQESSWKYEIINVLEIIPG